MDAVIADTHAAVWYLGDPAKLSGPALAALDRAAAAREPIYLSAISLVEVAYLVEKGKVPPAALTGLQDALADPDAALELVPLDLAVAQALVRIPRDVVPDMPDRIIAATALYLNLPLVSRDSKIRASAIRTIW